MKPYYEQSGITIYHGDCGDVVESFGLHWGEKPFDLMLTDPPYGIGKDGQTATTGGHGGRKAYEFRGWDSEPPTMELLMSLCGLARVQIIWGGNYFGNNIVDGERKASEYFSSGEDCCDDPPIRWRRGLGGSLCHPLSRGPYRAGVWLWLALLSGLGRT